jgi:hypothetical protein
MLLLMLVKVPLVEECSTSINRSVPNDGHLADSGRGEYSPRRMGTQFCFTNIRCHRHLGGLGEPRCRSVSARPRMSCS